MTPDSYPGYVNSLKNKPVKRLFFRTLAFLAMTALAFVLMRPLTMATGMPEVMRGLSAAALLSWAEITVMWVRITVSPAIDLQQLTLKVDFQTTYIVQNVLWFIRIMVFVTAYWFL